MSNGCKIAGNRDFSMHFLCGMAEEKKGDNASQTARKDFIFRIVKISWKRRENSFPLLIIGF
jgi:hypothetical protein